MKPNELMIDDWVYNKNIGKPMQVYPMMFSQMFRQTPNATTEDYNIFPISLTPEILEKNEFKQIGEKFIWGEIDDDLIEITPSINNSYRIAVSVADLMISCRIWCNHVHELQHALRICGIEKEIVL